MAVTVTQVGTVPYYVRGNQKVSVSDVALDSSYPTGGEVLTAAQLRMPVKVDYANAEIFSAATTTVNAASAGYTPGNGTTTSLLQIYDETPAEVADQANLAGLVVRVTAYGT